jgi:hypothetical protein
LEVAPNPGSSFTSATLTYIATSNPSINTVDAKGFDILGLADPAGDTVANKGRVTDTDNCTVNILCNPGIAVTKICDVVKNVDGTFTVNYSGTVTNTGDVILNGVTVTDDQGGAPINIGQLAVGGSAPYSGSYNLPATTPCSTDVTDNVTATGTFASICPAVNGGHTVSATTPATCKTPPCPPCIAVTKEIACAPVAPGTCDGTLSYSASATGVANSANPAFCYRIIVTNPAGTAGHLDCLDSLEQVAVSDPDLSANPLPGYPSTLAPGESATNYFSKTWGVAGSPHVNTVTASAVGVTSQASVSATASATATVLNINIDCAVTLFSSVDQDNNPGPPGDGHVTLPAGSVGAPVQVSVTLTNSGTADLIVKSLTVDKSLVDCVLPGAAIDPNTHLPVGGLPIAAGGSATVTLDCWLVTCPGGTITVTAHAEADSKDGTLCVYDSTGTIISDDSPGCTGTVDCATPVTCRVTGGGTLYNGDQNTDCIVMTTTLFPLSSGGIPLDHISHGGQLGAPFSHMDCGNRLADPCIRGQWQHTRHYVGKANPRDIFDMDFHSNTPKGLYDTLDCACLGCCSLDDVNQPNGKFKGILNNGKFELCNPDDHRICGPQPRPSPANAIVFTGIGTVKPATDTGVNQKVAEWVVFRVYIEDRSEPGGFFPKGSINPSDVYCFQAWKTGIPVAKKADGNALGTSPTLGDVNAFRTALSTASCNFLHSITVGGPVQPGSLPPASQNGIAADINDCGPLHSGNQQIHPSTSATCTQ